MRTVRITFYALGLCAFAVAVVFLVREYRKTERLDAVCGVWIAADNRSTLRIERYGRKHLIVVKRLDGRGRIREACHELFYRGCIGYRNASGRRVDLFTTPRKDALLMIPGGSYRRLSLETNP